MPPFRVSIQNPKTESENLDLLAQTLTTAKETSKDPTEKALLEKAVGAMINALQIKDILYQKKSNANESTSLNFLRAYLWNKYLALAESHDQSAVNQYIKDLYSFFSGVSVVDIIESKECADALQEANVGPQDKNIILKSLIGLKLRLGEEFKLTRNTYEFLTLAAVKYSNIRRKVSEHF